MQRTCRGDRHSEADDRADHCTRRTADHSANNSTAKAGTDHLVSMRRGRMFAGREATRWWWDVHRLPPASETRWAYGLRPGRYA